ncbi:MAG: leucyl/phenylalanyl-tRNA--protein transferase [Myxococcales bacterium]|nr:leucyl/phenylalanyl-tRNA--protein transferase [Myxococcales bacterium]
MRRRRPPHFIEPGGPLFFPDPADYDDEGLVAVGGDLSTERLLLAYDSGIFPWYDEGMPPLWWSPNPRAILDLRDLHVSRSMLRVMRQGFTLTWNRDFAAVMRGCADREEGTWILPEMQVAYAELHRLGHAHSLEVWQGGELAGGLYGVQRGGLFAAESMFHRVTNASKLALIATVRAVFGRGVQLFDTQLLTPHLSSLGGRAAPRRAYLADLARARARSVDLNGLQPSDFMPEMQS